MEDTLEIKVAAKSGGVSVYGLQRFPVTLYAEQWERLLKDSEKILAFIQEHRSELKTKS